MNHEQCKLFLEGFMCYNSTKDSRTTQQIDSVYVQLQNMGSILLPV